MSAPITRRTLFDSDLVCVGECLCHSRRSGCAGEEAASRHTFVFVRSGLFVHHSASRRDPRGKALVGDPTRVLLFSKGEPYRVSHPLDGGDACTTLSPSARLLGDALAEFDPAAAERPDAPLPFDEVACDPTSFLLAVAPDPLAVEERACALIRATLARGFAQRRLRHELGAARAARATTAAAHRELVEATRAVLAGRFRRRLALDEVARAVHASPYHLCRLFRATTGMTMQRFTNRLRVRAALARLAGGARDLTAVAVACGFYDHSHFTHAFRREFGVPPSAWREARPDLVAGFGNRLQA
jgi:AraC-like DNA-binding protein